VSQIELLIATFAARHNLGGDLMSMIRRFDLKPPSINHGRPSPGGSAQEQPDDWLLMAMATGSR
jgi:hypothetical protein